MKGNQRILALLSLAFGFAISALSHAETEEHPAQEKKGTYELGISQAEDLYAEQLDVLSKQYAAALDSLSGELQKQGDLDGILAVKSELERFGKTGVVPAEKTGKTHASVLKLRQIFNESRIKADAARARTTAELTGDYLAYLKELQKTLTQDGELEQAIQVKAEATRIEKFKAGMPTVKPGEPAAGNHRLPTPNTAARAGSGLLLHWSQAQPEAMLGPDGRAVPGSRFDHQGGNATAKDGTLAMAGGRTAIEGFNRTLLEACREAQQWSLVLHFESASLDQSGPARIFSFSQDGHLRNFSLCQEKDQLVLRLRTTKTGDNGSNPEVKLGGIGKGKLHKIAVTYEPGKLAFYMDGKAIPVKQIDGDFSNWKEYQVVLGNEWKDDRPWKGTFHQFALYSSALSEGEALASTR